jgi:hypothetical protein
MQRHAGPRRGARAAGVTLPDGPQRALASRASHAPRMGPHAHGADPLACVKWHAPPCSGMRAPCEAPGRLDRALPLAGSGPAPAARRMGRAWARMGRAAPTLLRGATWHAPPCGDMRTPCEASGRLGRALPLARRRAIVSRAPHGPRMGPHMGRAAPTSTRGCMCSPCSGMRAHARRLGGRAAPFPLAGSGPVSAARRMRRAWARMGRCTWRCWLLPRVSSRSRVCGVV